MDKKDQIILQQLDVIRSMTEQIFRVMDLKGVVRVDYIIDKAEKLE